RGRGHRAVAFDSRDLYASGSARDRVRSLNGAIPRRPGKRVSVAAAGRWARCRAAVPLHFLGARDRLSRQWTFRAIERQGTLGLAKVAERVGFEPTVRY